MRNIVFMGMGEPFHNEATIYDVIGKAGCAGAIPLSAGPHPHFDGWHSGCDGPLCPPIS